MGYFFDPPQAGSRKGDRNLSFHRYLVILLLRARTNSRFVAVREPGLSSSLSRTGRGELLSALLQAGKDEVQ